MTLPGESVTRRQLDVLIVVDEHGPVTASDVAYHLSISIEAARGRLARLERRKLVDIWYTHAGERGRAFVTTERGTAEANR